VERERMRIPDKTEEAYNDFFTSDDFDRLFKELIIDKLAISQIVLLLKDKSLSTGEIAEVLGLTPSDVSKHIINASKQGLVRYDERRKSYALA
jgi:DNA-binding MarR family transcriptional regulator